MAVIEERERDDRRDEERRMEDQMRSLIKITIAEMQKQTACNEKGCTPLQLISREVLATSKAMEDNSDRTNATLDKVRDTAVEMQRMLALTTERLSTGSSKFAEIESEIKEMKRVATAVSILQDRMPTRFGSAATGGGTATVLITIWEIIKTRMIG